MTNTVASIVNQINAKSLVPVLTDANTKVLKVEAAPANPRVGKEDFTHVALVEVDTRVGKTPEQLAKKIGRGIVQRRVYFNMPEPAPVVPPAPPAPDIQSVIAGDDLIEVGATTQLSVSAPGKTGLTGTWSSSDAGVATVSDTGLVTGVSENDVTITWTSTTAGVLSSTFALDVTAAPPQV